MVAERKSKRVIFTPCPPSPARRAIDPSENNRTDAWLNAWLTDLSVIYPELADDIPGYAKALHKALQPLSALFARVLIRVLDLRLKESLVFSMINSKAPTPVAHPSSNVFWSPCFVSSTVKVTNLVLFCVSSASTLVWVM